MLSSLLFRRRFTALACLAFFLRKPGASEACASVESVGQSALLGHVYKNTSGIPLVSCSAACSEDKRCYSFNFIPATETCELNEAARSAVHPSFFVRRPGSLYFDKLQTVPVPSSCDSSPCRNGAACQEINREPGFECADFSCPFPSALGMQDGRIANHQITASAHVPHHPPYNARLHSNSSWVANLTSFLQIGFYPKFKVITGVATQGDPDEWWYVKKYSLSYSANGQDWKSYPQVLNGNNNPTAVKRNDLAFPFRARFIRFRPEYGAGEIALRVEVYGCDTD